MSHDYTHPAKWHANSSFAGRRGPLLLRLPHPGRHANVLALAGRTLRILGDTCRPLEKATCSSRITKKSPDMSTSTAARVAFAALFTARALASFIHSSSASFIASSTSFLLLSYSTYTTTTNHARTQGRLRRSRLVPAAAKEEGSAESRADERSCSRSSASRRQRRTALCWRLASVFFSRAGSAGQPSC